MILAHKIRLDPNNKQLTYFYKACDFARFAYIWALAECKRLYEAGEKVNEGILRKCLNNIKHTEFTWLLEVTKCAPQSAIKDSLNKDFRNFFRGFKKGQNIGCPKIKKKGIKDSFSLPNDQIGAAVSRKADSWFVSVQVEIPDTTPVHSTISENQATGVDLGVKDLAVLSDCTKITAAKPHKALLSRIRRLNQSLSRKQGAKKGEKKSQNIKKAQMKLFKLHIRIADIRNDEVNKLINMLTNNYSIIGVEDLNVSGMSKNHRFARTVLDMSFFEFRRQLEYKTKRKGGHVILADRFYPSSKICYGCGYKNDDLTLSMRKWTCPDCGVNHDRDMNAATILRKYAASYMASACGELGTVTSNKQELNITIA